MRECCHRCGDQLPSGNGESPFCPHCGSPQLRLSLDYQSTETGGDQVDGEPRDGQSTATSPLPPPLAPPRKVDWKTAIRCAIAVGGVAAALNLLGERFAMATALGSIWTLCASIIAIGLYQQRRPTAWIDAGIGARIGAVVGLALGVCGAASMGVAGLLARYWLHQDPSINAQLTPALAQMQQSFAANPAERDLVRVVGSPEFRAGFLLAALGLGSAFILVLSTASGAMSGLMRAKRPSSV